MLKKKVVEAALERMENNIYKMMEESLQEAINSSNFATIAKIMKHVEINVKYQSITVDYLDNICVRDEAKIIFNNRVFSGKTVDDILTAFENYAEETCDGISDVLEQYAAIGMEVIDENTLRGKYIITEETGTFVITTDINISKEVEDYIYERLQ